MKHLLIFIAYIILLPICSFFYFVNDFLSGFFFFKFVTFKFIFKKPEANLLILSYGYKGAVLTSILICCFKVTWYNKGVGGYLIIGKLLTLY